MSGQAQLLGEHGEKIAERWLIGNGWQIVARRFRSGHRDIDLIASRPEGQGRLVAFVEVKARRAESFGGPLGAVNWKKRRELFRSAMVWVSRFQERNDAYRFDVIAVLVGRERARVQHIENAFFVPTRS